jgi:hypothetical protein
LGQVARGDPRMQSHTKISTWYRARTKLPKSDRVLQLHENGALALSLAGEGRVGGRWWRGGAYGGSEDTKVDEPGAWVHVSA